MNEGGNEAPLGEETNSLDRGGEPKVEQDRAEGPNADDVEQVKESSVADVPGGVEDADEPGKAESAVSSAESEKADDLAKTEHDGEEDEEEDEVDIILDPLTLTETTMQQQQGLLPNMNSNVVGGGIHMANRVTLPPSRISQLYMNNRRAYNASSFNSSGSPAYAQQRVGMAIPTSLDTTHSPSALRNQQTNIMNILQSGMRNYELELDPDSFEEKAWNRPNEKLSDYFNYGFNPETWKLFLLRQRKFREENSNAANKKSHFSPNTSSPSHRAASSKGSTSKGVAEDDRHARSRQDRDDRGSVGSNAHVPEVSGGSKSEGGGHASSSHSHRKESINNTVAVGGGHGGGSSGGGGSCSHHSGSSSHSHRSRDRRGFFGDSTNDRMADGGRIDEGSIGPPSDRNDRDRAFEREKFGRADRDVKSDREWAERDRIESWSSRRDDQREHYSSRRSSHGRHEEKYSSRLKSHRNRDRGYLPEEPERKRART
ncbi:uncharacterized protein LOC126325499 [Schistocerca gregaria]|uniref:uncharacterized protein LOC126325499 n=1 Tax=Schistocerca gregaria TaxID=7010 RepID=UPI00211EBE93|nr:uncharacterized protein LOC126325499 [Schistocerca gregaria]